MKITLGICNSLFKRLILTKRGGKGVSCQMSLLERILKSAGLVLNASKLDVMCQIYIYVYFYI